MAAHKVHCCKLGGEREGLPHAPMPGPMGERIYREVSAEAWKEWLGHATMVINENRLNPAEPNARARLRAELMKFFFEGGAERPAGYTPPAAPSGQGDAS